MKSSFLPPRSVRTSIHSRMRKRRTLSLVQGVGESGSERNPCVRSKRLVDCLGQPTIRDLARGHNLLRGIGGAERLEAISVRRDQP